MTKGFPRHMAELAERASGHVNLAEVFDHPEGDTLFVDTHNRYHDIRLHTKRVLCIEEAFNEVMAGSWGSMFGLPVAPVLFDYQPVDKPNAHEAGGYGSFISSVQMHKHTVLVETVLEHAEVRGKNKPYKNHSFDATMWNTLTRELEIPPLLHMEAAVFHHAIKPISELLPYMEWIGCTDLNASNQVLDTNKVLHLVHDHGDAQGNTLGFYLCDFAANSLEVSGMEHMRAEDIARIDVRSPTHALSNMVEFYPSMRAAETKLARAAGEDDWYGVKQDYPDALIIPVFAPHLDFPSMRKTVTHIQQLDDETVRSEMSRLANTMARIIPDESMIERLNIYANYMANALITRRDCLIRLVDSQLSHETNPHAHTNNPFEVFKNVIAEEVDGYRERKRLLTGASRPARKPKPAPNNSNDHE